MVVDPEVQLTVKLGRRVAETLTAIANEAELARLDITRLLLLIACGRKPRVPKPVLGALHEVLARNRPLAADHGEIVTVSIRVPRDALPDVERAAGAARMTRHEWMRVVLTVACGDSAFPAQLGGLYRSLRMSLPRA